MDDTIKIFGGVILGFLLAPLTEAIKYTINLKINKSKLLNKLRSYEKITYSAIYLTHKTMEARNRFITEPIHSKEVFVSPNTSFPPIELNFEASYELLSTLQRESIPIIISTTKYLISLQTKIAERDNDFIKELSTNKTNNFIEIRLKECEKHSHILPTEDAFLVTAIYLLNRIRYTIADRIPTPTDDEMFIRTVDEFSIPHTNLMKNMVIVRTTTSAGPEQAN